MTDTVLISKDVKLTARLTAKEIWVKSSGEVILILKQYGAPQQIPQLTAAYLDSLCSRFYFGSYKHQGAIADILLLNSALTHSQYDSFYQALCDNLESQNLTLITSPLFR